MKKILFFAALLGFAVACGGQQTEEKKAEEQVATEEVATEEVATEEAVEEEAEPEAPAATTVKKPAAQKPVAQKPAEPAKEEEKKTLTVSNKTVGVKGVQAKEEGQAEGAPLKASEFTNIKSVKAVGDKPATEKKEIGKEVKTTKKLTISDSEVKTGVAAK